VLAIIESRSITSDKVYSRKQNGTGKEKARRELGLAKAVLACTLALKDVLWDTLECLGAAILILAI
jgi:hypothetical protein